MRTDHDIAALALEWHRAGREPVLATVIETWGSAPRGVGSQVLIDSAGAMEGSVSGGCVEGAVIVEAMEAARDGLPRLLTYGVSDEDAFAVGLACGGTIRVLVEPVGGAVSVQDLEALVATQDRGDPAGWAVSLSSGVRRFVLSADYPDRFRLDRSGVEDDGDTFVLIRNPPLRMVIVGAVHIAQTLVQLGRLAGYDVTVVDPRHAFAAKDRFPGVSVVEDWPDEALAALKLDARTAVVTLTHDPKLDDPAIKATLASDAFYLGCLGSKRTHAKRVARLSLSGVSTDQMARIHAPVGLNIGGRAPEEIALSIMAEMTQVLRQP